ncbi:pilus assembly protein TadG-related protein [Iamia majanohamensis]|uniref:Pilus assembly protein TadG-related protein n=1 Tax=Iamia majanohamensis TaxID=467976 RepID=A0AAE9Y928_9ACTN|nr:pilus assembly protein TadG-related protein [Iamia majanohamensis]WCO68877.1 pilus assembly protein TadG-related protein [Iamia majanohamensis]
MRVRHHRAASRLATTEWSRRRRQGGYILVKFALLLIPLMLMAGLSIDVGYWYNRTSDLQKAADAAALAGVVWLPDVDEAKTQARAAATRNGFTNGVDGITVQVEKVAGTTRQLRVTIADPAVGSFFFENLGGNTIDLSRSATAEYVLPVPLGSPEDRFGGTPYSDPSYPAAKQANLWGNIHGRKTDNYKGDAYAPECRGSDNCSGQSNPDHRDSGYLYAIDVAEGTYAFGVEIFDAGLYDRGSDESVATGDRRYTTNGSTTTRWTMYAADETELDVSDNPTARSEGICIGGSYGNGDFEIAQGADATTYKDKWQYICGVTNPKPGRYLLRVETLGNGSAANRYAIRVPTIGGSARISAYGDFSMYNNIEGGSASFYLAEVGPEHRGKTLELRMYDPGEVSASGSLPGNGTMRVLPPTGTSPACRASSDSPNRTFTNGATLSDCKFTTASNGSAKFNGYWVNLSIKLPNNYSCTPGTLPGCWWRIRYDIQGQGNDTTTWAAQIIGDPVHLIEEDVS